MTLSQEPASRDVWKSIAAGALGGLVASYVMNRFSAAVHSARSFVSECADKGSADPSSSGNLSQAHPGADDATVKAARAISDHLLAEPLAPEGEKEVGLAVHYFFGIAAGAAYGGLNAAFPVTSIGRGLPYGIAIWLLANEVGTPLSGLSKPPWQVPAFSHVSALANHVIYGLVTDFTTRTLLSVTSTTNRLAQR
jgi:hypothetical protein